MMDWKHLIVSRADVSPASLVNHELNPRVHGSQQEVATAESLDRFGWLDEVIVNRRNGKILNGHLRVAICAKRGEKTVPVQYVDVDEKTELHILATFDRMGAMATIDQGKIAILVEQSGLDSEVLREMLSQVMTGAEIPTLSDEPMQAEEVRIIIGDFIVKIHGNSFASWMQSLQLEFVRPNDLVKELSRRLGI